jgi:hypothetical protein
MESKSRSTLFSNAKKRNVSKCIPRDATLIAGLVLFPIKNAALEVRCF